jgi:DNA-binding beta-propeller fold protein YncE
VGVNPVTNSVYLTKNIISPTVTPGLVVLDGASNAITAAVLSRDIRGPQDVVVYPAANKVYFLNLQTNDVSIIDVDGHQTVPLSTTVAG